VRLVADAKGAGLLGRMDWERVQLSRTAEGAGFRAASRGDSRS
jgi:hypothetical protein